MTENPDWLRLIRHWVIGGVHYGYSFPFLMGARAKKNRLDKITQKDTQLLIDEIFFHPVSGNIIQVIFCPELYIPVFGIYRNEKDVPGIFFQIQFSHQFLYNNILLIPGEILLKK